MKRPLSLLLFFALVAGACSDDASSDTTATPSVATTASQGASAGVTETTATGSDGSAATATTAATGETTTTGDGASLETTTTAGTATATTTTTTGATTTTIEPDDDVTETTTTAAVDEGFPVTVISDAGATTIPARPTRIAALSPTHVEMLYAIGAGDRIIAVDMFSNFPAEAAGKTQLDAFNLSVEEVIATDPDLVVLTFDPVGAVAALESVGIPTLLLGTATTLQSAYLQMAVLGSATGLEDESELLVEQVSDGIAGVIEIVGDSAEGVTYYHESDPFTFYTPTSLAFIGQIYASFGMENIADAAPDAAGETFPQLSPEFIVDADPEMIFSTDPSGDISVYIDREGWGAMSAVTNGSVYFLDGDVASRWGPRLLDLVEAMAAAIEAHTG